MPATKPRPEVGSYVKLTRAGLSAAGKPAQLVKIGWPNQFLVADVLEEDGKVFLLLDPCCGWMLESDKKRKLSCEGHPAEHFQVVQIEAKDPAPKPKEASEADPNSGRFSAFSVDGEEIFSVEFGDGEKDRKHTATVQLPGGKTLSLVGREAKFLNEFILSKLGF